MYVSSLKVVIFYSNNDTEIQGFRPSHQFHVNTVCVAWVAADMETFNIETFIVQRYKLPKWQY